MISSFFKEKTGILVFGLAALIAPLATLVPASCGAACGGCPLAGGCLVVPAVAAGAGLVGFRTRIRSWFSKIGRRA